ncbi:MFS transporter [Streptomyces sp. NBC_00249]|uniref:MFS transporter n=1 Tax=Streptomyces sp. NBC_00249 TaxID=2975690 RepID=UPI0022589F00|nr:MFS transporter [Streptomyces sp. NBC_00249]MCX5198462.1 MFS transporter [Streptomyces sp. NBC_00249]
MPTRLPTTTGTRSPWRSSGFRVLFFASTLSVLGTNVSYVAVPLVAVLALDAGPGQVGLLASLSTAAFLLIGLPAGAWVDRLRPGTVLAVADLLRGGLLAWVPLAWWFDVLTFEGLCVAVFLSGVATVFFDVASQSALPQLVGPESLVPANSAMVSLMAAGNVAGRGAGGALVQLVGAPAAVVCAAVGYLGSGLRLVRTARSGARGTTAAPGGAGRGPDLRALISEGLRHVLRHGELRALALTGALGNLGTVMVNTMLPVVFSRELGLSAGALGLFWAVGGVGLFLGARCARRLADRFGHGRGLVLADVCLAPTGLLVPLMDRGVWLWAAGAGWLLFAVRTGTSNVLGVSLRQRLTPGTLLGRMNATFRFLLTGAMALGAGLAGAMGAYASPRAALWAGGALLCLSFVPTLASPLRGRRALPPAGTEGSADLAPRPPDDGTQRRASAEPLPPGGPTRSRRDPDA